MTEDNNNHGGDKARAFLGMISRLVTQAGIGWNCNVSVQTVDERGVPITVQTTPAQLVSDLCGLLSEANALAEAQLDMFDGEDDEPEPPRKTRKRR